MITENEKMYWQVVCTHLNVRGEPCKYVRALFHYRVDAAVFCDHSQSVAIGSKLEIMPLPSEVTVQED